MATEILKRVQANCPRDLKTIEDVLAMKSNNDMNISNSYFAIPLSNSKLISCSDILVGFVAITPTTFTFSFGVDYTLTLKKSLNTGEFQFALYDNPFPIISSMYHGGGSISNLNGSGYIIYTTLDYEQRKVLQTSGFNLGDYYFNHGLISYRRF
jgi:hypothetical protein